MSCRVLDSLMFSRQALFKCSGKKSCYFGIICCYFIDFVNDFKRKVGTFCSIFFTLLNGFLRVYLLWRQIVCCPLYFVYCSLPINYLREGHGTKSFQVDDHNLWQVVKEKIPLRFRKMKAFITEILVGISEPLS